jgi:RNA-directed DNA polymerase
MGKPYFWGKKAATSAANLCCRDTVLPQGAPTSPIIANMVCAKLDSELKTLAKKFHATYTRYADDITFSTMSQSFPKVLAVHAGELTRQVEVGDELRKIIESNGFSVNTKKTRLARHERQEVTGLTTNRFPNVQRRFVRQIRAMIHAWRRHGLDKAQSEYWTKFDHRNRQGKRPSFARVVRGKIEFVGSVRGKIGDCFGNMPISTSGMWTVIISFVSQTGSWSTIFENSKRPYGCCSTRPPFSRAQRFA